MTSTSHSKVLRLPDVCARIGLKRASIYKMMAADKFPRPIKLTERSVGWRLSDLEQWLAERETT
ncbi:MAG: AlpA family transcriptional regulator [Pelagibaca sp.]|nr:AlpA family transcriptional regulator [Pelagibaca sp.]